MLRVLYVLVPPILLGACVDHGDEGMDILNNTTVPSGNACTLTGMVGQAFTSQGVISTASPVGYLATPLFESRITALVGHESQKTIHLEGATVHLTLPVGSTGIMLDSNEQAFDAPFSGDLPPTGTANVGFVMVPESVIAKVRALAMGGTAPVAVELKANVVAYGDLAGSRIEATPWIYPVTVCNNCVVAVVGPCPASGTGLVTGNPCNIFQDGTVDCCTDSTGGLVCPATTM
jgi:hypothetical protein